MDIEGLPVNRISAEEARKRIGMGEVIVLDARKDDEYVGELGHIEGSVLIPVQELEQRLAEIEPHRDKEIITVCKSGKRSATAAGILIRAGFTKVSTIDGGMIRWNELRYPVTREPGRYAVH